VQKISRILKSMTEKLSKKPLLSSLSLGIRVTPIALSLVASATALGQFAPNRYDQYRHSIQFLPSVQVTPVPSYPAGIQSVPSAPQAIHSYAIPMGHSKALPATTRLIPALSAPAVTRNDNPYPRHPEAAAGRTSVPTTKQSHPQRSNDPTLAPGSQSMNQWQSSPAKPMVLPSPNFANVQEVGQGLGTPGLITPGSVERMEQSGLVVEDFRPPQPRPENFSLEGLPPEPRRAFYDQLQVPERGRVMSARVLTDETPDSPPSNEAPAVSKHVAPIPLNALPQSEPLRPTTPLAGVEPTPILDATRKATQSASNALSIPEVPLRNTINDSVISPSTVNPTPTNPTNVLPSPTIAPAGIDIAETSEQAAALETQFSKQLEEMQTKVKILSEQNAKLEFMVNAMTEKLSKLEPAHREMEKQLKTALKSKEANEDFIKPNKQDALQIDNDKAPEKKDKKKPKIRVEV